MNTPRFPSPSRNHAVIKSCPATPLSHDVVRVSSAIFDYAEAGAWQISASRVRLTASYAVVRFSSGNIGTDLSIDILGWRSSMAEQRFCKPDRDERPLVIPNGYKGFFVASLVCGG
jgi:hypothetical protein